VVAATYPPGLTSGFVWLDEKEILQHGLIVDRLEEIPGRFVNDRNYAGYHRPVYNLLHSLDAAIWGFRPLGFRLTPARRAKSFPRAGLRFRATP